AGALDADIDVNLLGKSFTTLRGTAAVSRLSGTVEGITIDPSTARLDLTESRVIAESVFVTTSAGTVRASGALGLHADVRDTLDVHGSVSLAELGPLLCGAGRMDSVARDTTSAKQASAVDSMGGRVTLRARLVGSVDSLDADAEGDADTVTSPFRGKAR